MKIKNQEDLNREHKEIESLTKNLNSLTTKLGYYENEIRNLNLKIQNNLKEKTSMKLRYEENIEDLMNQLNSYKDEISRRDQKIKQSLIQTLNLIDNN